MARRPRGPSPTRFGQPKPFNEKHLDKLPDNKPVVYEGLTPAGTNRYTGVAQRGRVQERMREHLNDGDLPGVTQIRIKQMPTITDARAAERRIIKTEKPKLNKV